MSGQRFAGKVVLITGGTSGLGRAATLAFAREEAVVVIAGRNAERGESTRREIEARGARSAFIQADVSQDDQVGLLIRRTLERFGRLDCAFNNAATIEVGTFKRAAEFSEEDFDRHMALNLKSVWLCMKHEIEVMLRLGTGGAIVNTSSVNGLGGVPQNAFYAAAKAGVLALTKSTAMEYAGQGIRVNALVAGAFRAPMLERVLERIAPENAGGVEAKYAEIVPLGRIGRPEEAAAAVLWLCSEAASYVTGHSMIVDGGMTAPYR